MLLSLISILEQQISAQSSRLLSLSTKQIPFLVRFSFGINETALELKSDLSQKFVFKV